MVLCFFSKVFYFVFADFFSSQRYVVVHVYAHQWAMSIHETKNNYNPDFDIQVAYVPSRIE